MLDLTHSQPLLAAHDPLRRTRFDFLARLIGKAMARAYRLARKDRYDDFRIEWVHGAPFIVIPSVFNPKVPRTGEFLATQLDARLLHADSEVLDMGTGSGVCAVFAARHARRVVAVDINAAAVRCAGINARLNQLEHRIDIRHGDLFQPVSAERFDLVLFNPPFLQGPPRDDRDRAWRSSDVAERFAAGLGAHLKPGAAALVLLSTFGDARAFLDGFRQHGFAIAVWAERRYVNEKLAIFRLTLPDPRDAP
ncbi:MAG TPA: methyltransferase [Steroidobacteraceae bacterium]|jgi:HemK-related putative methylase|nr:methyltransferase [Steroidobacteraceae bacterium]